MNGKIIVVALIIGVAIIGSIAIFDAGVFSSITSTCGQNLTEESYSFTSSTTISVKLCKVGTPETVTSYQVTDLDGVIIPSNSQQFTATPISSSPTTIQVQLANGYMFHPGYSYYLYISTNLGTHKYTVAW